MSRVASLLKSRRVGALMALAIIVSLAVPLLIGGKQALIQIRDLPAKTYLILFLVIAVSWLARALKLHLLLRTLGATLIFARAFAISLAIDFAFISTPAGIGGYAACLYFSRRSGISISGATTLTFVDQLLDLSFFVCILPIAALSLAWTDLPKTLSMLAFGTSAVVIVAGIVAALMHRQLVQWLCSDNLFTRRWPRLRDRQQHLREFIASVKRDSKLLLAGPPTTTVLIVVSTAIQWITRYGVLWVALILLGHRVPFALTLLSQSLVLHAAMWTGVPAGGGSAELGLGAALLMLVPSTTIATALILWRLTTFHLCLVAGSIALAWLARWKSGDSASEQTADSVHAELQVSDRGA